MVRKIRAKLVLQLRAEGLSDIERSLAPRQCHANRSRRSSRAADAAGLSGGMMSRTEC